MEAASDGEGENKESTGLSTRERIIRNKLEKEIKKMKQLSSKDQEFKALVEKEDMETKI